MQKMRVILLKCSEFENAPAEKKSRKQILKYIKTTFFAL